MNITVRRYKDGDAPFICEVIKADVLAENIKDYPKEIIDNIINNHDEALIERRASKFHVYVLEDNQKIVGVGMIGPYWDSMTESSFFTIFIDPKYKGLGLGRIIIETLEQDEYYKRADRIEIPASLTALEFYKHFGFGFKKMGHIASIVDGEGIYRMEKYPKLSNNNCDIKQYNMRPYIDNEYHNYKEFIYQVKKDAYKKYVEECYGLWNEEEQRKYYESFISSVKDDTWIIQLNGIDIGFYNGRELEDGSYEIGNICIVPEYQGRGIGTQVLKDVMELHNNQVIHIQYFKQNPVGKLYERLGFIMNGKTDFHYQMIKPKQSDIVRKMHQEIINRSNIFEEQTMGTKDEYNIYRYHIQYVYRYILILSQNKNVDSEVLELSALLHDIAMTERSLDRSKHNEYGSEIAEHLLRKNNYPEDKIELVKKCILNHSSKRAGFRTTDEEQILVDADGLSHFDSIYNLYSLAHNVMELNDEDTLKYIQDKLTKDYNEISDNLKYLIEDKYNKVMNAQNINELIDNIHKKNK